MDGSNEEVKSTETTKTIKEEKKEDKEKEVKDKDVKEKKRNSQHLEPSPKTSTKAVRSVYPTRRLEKVNKEPLNKERILDPLDLLEPVYEEVTKESVPPKLKEIKSIPMKKGKLKKRKVSEEREESPPPLFLSRKGTRSRPNVKIPKYYHTHYERVSDATIVREPHTDQADDPLMQVEEIKAEPLDLDDDVIEIEDNVIGFPDITPHDEEIIGNYDSPLVNLNDNTDKAGDLGAFKKINLVAHPIIMNIHSIAEKSPSSVQIIDLEQLKETAESSDKVDDPLATIPDMESDKVAEDPLNFDSTSDQRGAAGITITNVQSIADLEEEEEKKEETEGESSEICIEKIVGEKEDADPVVVMEKEAHGSETVVAVPAVIISGGRTEDVVEKTTINDEVLVVAHPEENLLEKDSEREQEDNTQTSNNENQAEAAPLTEPEEKTVNDSEAAMAETEENVTALGFHIAKVASEQFSVGENFDGAVISENCASELGFQITNVVSGQFEDADVKMSEDADVKMSEDADVKMSEDVGVGDLETFSNHLSEAEGEVNESGVDMAGSNAVQSERAGILSEETQFLAESLERLLDE